MPFDVADVNNIEMYRNVVPNSAEKRVITKTDDIEAIYFLFSGLEVSDKKTEPVAGGTVTSIRFNLSNDTSYEIIYCAEAVKSGRLKLPEEKLDYFTAADIESYWDNYQYEIVPVSENELPGQEETQEWDKIPMVMVDGKLYYDTGKESTISGRCGVMDGEITSTVDGSEIPTKDNQSIFGTGFEYQYGADNTIEIFMNEKWIVFEQREGAGNQVRYGDRMVDAEGLSKETLEWLSNDIFGKVVQLKRGVTIDRDKTSINLNENMDNLVPASKISDLPTGWICGQVARDFVKTKTGRGGSMNIQEAEEFKTSKFFCKTDFDMEEIKKEEDGYVPLPKFYTFPSKEERERILYRNFVKVGQDVKEMIKDVVNKKGQDEIGFMCFIPAVPVFTQLDSASLRQRKAAENIRIATVRACHTLHQTL